MRVSCLGPQQVGTLFAAQAGASGFQITSIEVDDTNLVTLTWDSAPGKFYDVEVSGDPGDKFLADCYARDHGSTRPCHCYFSVRSKPCRGCGAIYAGPPSGPPPFLETSFEDGMGDWTVAGDGTVWEFGTPTSGPGAANTGSGAVATGLAGDYTDGTVTQLRTPVIDPGETDRVKLEFSYFLQAAEGHGGQISILEQTGLSSRAWKSSTWAGRTTPPNGRKRPFGCQRLHPPVRLLSSLPSCRPKTAILTMELVGSLMTFG